jgi:hypothetical protein
MLGHFLLEPEAEEPVELLDVPLPEATPVVPDAELVLDVVEPALVAALATSAPPATSPLVNAPTASALRKRSFMVCPFCCSVWVPPHMREHWPLCGLDLWVGPEARGGEVRVLVSRRPNRKERVITE